MRYAKTQRTSASRRAVPRARCGRAARPIERSYHSDARWRQHSRQIQWRRRFFTERKGKCESGLTSPQTRHVRFSTAEVSSSCTAGRGRSTRSAWPLRSAFRRAVSRRWQLAHRTSHFSISRNTRGQVLPSSRTCLCRRSSRRGGRTREQQCLSRRSPRTDVRGGRQRCCVCSHLAGRWSARRAAPSRARDCVRSWRRSPRRSRRGTMSGASLRLSAPVETQRLASPRRSACTFSHRHMRRGANRRK